MDIFTLNLSSNLYTDIIIFGILSYLENR